jgi:hypothetical protein
MAQATAPILDSTAARWCPGVVRLVMDGLQPARVPDAVIEGIRGRERNGAVELPRRLLKSGDRVRLLAGPFQGHLAIYAGIPGPSALQYCCKFSVASSGSHSPGAISRR